jgi:hypothetical protein
MFDFGRFYENIPKHIIRVFPRIVAGVPRAKGLQHQKQLRLLEARRLTVTDTANVETAAFQVGYESRRSSAANTHACSAHRPGATLHIEGDCGLTGSPISNLTPVRGGRQTAISQELLAGAG